jgi:fructosamine-3-kinase
MPQTNDIHDTLATYDAEPVRELHRVRPHATYEVRFRGERAVCKLATHPLGDPETEARTIQYVRRETSVPVPEVLAVGDDHLVARWCDAVPDEPPERDEDRIRALGRGLAILHSETATDFDCSGRLQHRDGHLEVDEGNWSDTLLGLLSRRERYLDTVGYGDLARRVADTVREHRHRLEVVDDTVLVHGNYFGEHVATDADDTTAVIDFEHTLVGSPEWDYLRTVGPVFGPGADHDVPEKCFREAYEAVRPLPPGFDERRPLSELVNGVSYLRSLHLQRGNLDDRQTVARRARALANHVHGRLNAFAERDE